MTADAPSWEPNGMGGDRGLEAKGVHYNGVANLEAKGVDSLHMNGIHGRNDNLEAKGVANASAEGIGGVASKLSTLAIDEQHRRYQQELWGDNLADISADAIPPLGTRYAYASPDTGGSAEGFYSTRYDEVQEAIQASIEGYSEDLWEGNDEDVEKARKASLEGYNQSMTTAPGESKKFERDVEIHIDISSPAASYAIIKRVKERGIDLLEEKWYTARIQTRDRIILEVNRQERKVVVRLMNPPRDAEGLKDQLEVCTKVVLMAVENARQAKRSLAQQRTAHIFMDFSNVFIGTLAKVAEVSGIPEREVDARNVILEVEMLCKLVDFGATPEKSLEEEDQSGGYQGDRGNPGEGEQKKKKKKKKPLRYAAGSTGPSATKYEPYWEK